MHSVASYLAAVIPEINLTTTIVQHEFSVGHSIMIIHIFSVFSNTNTLNELSEKPMILSLNDCAQLMAGMVD